MKEFKTGLKFNKFNYISDWVFGNNKVEFIENFMFDDESKHIQNKHIMYMKGIKYYKKLAIDNGFELIKIIDLLPVNHDDNYIYIFKKIWRINYLLKIVLINILCSTSINTNKIFQEDAFSNSNKHINSKQEIELLNTLDKKGFGTDWYSGNIITLAEWLNIASLYILILDKEITYYKNLVNNITFIGLLFSTITSTISLSQLSLSRN